MTTEAVLQTRPQRNSERKPWIQMLGYSLVLHAALLLAATTQWGFSIRTPHFGPVYSVELVSLPATPGNKSSTLQTGRTPKPVARQQAIPIQRFQAKGQPLVLKKKERPEMQGFEMRESETMEKTLTKIDRRIPPAPSAPVKAQEAPRRPVSNKKQVSLVNIGGMKGGELSQALGLYRALVNDLIERNWVFPARLSPEDTELEATVVVRARRDGAILDMHFEKNSGNPYFDDSVLKAIIKSKPFPPFPDIYSPREEEIVIRFSPPKGTS